MSLATPFEGPRRTSALNLEELAAFASKSDDWKKIQQVVVALFQKKPVSGDEMMTVTRILSLILDSPGGNFLQEYYNDQLLMRGMIILRYPLRTLNGRKLLAELAATWNFFFAEILPVLSTIFYKIESKTASIRTVTMKAFKEIVIHKLRLLPVFKEHKKIVAEDVDLRHMLLTLLTTTEKGHPDLKLEQLLTYVVNPFLGHEGLFRGPGEPVIRASQPTMGTGDPLVRRKSSKDKSAEQKRPNSAQPNIKSGLLSPPSVGRHAKPTSSAHCTTLASSPRQSSMPDLGSSLPIIPSLIVEWTETAAGIQRDLVPEVRPQRATTFIESTNSSTATSTTTTMLSVAGPTLDTVVECGSADETNPQEQFV